MRSKWRDILDRRSPDTGGTLFETFPAARTIDPTTSKTAALIVGPGNETLIATIRWWVEKQSQPVSAFEIAAAISGARWSDATVRSAVSRAQLRAVDTEGCSPRGQRCIRYSV